MKRRAVIIIALLAVTAAAFAFAGYELSARGSAPVRLAGTGSLKPKLVASLQGFEPGSVVAYKIIPPAGDTVSGQGQASEKGILTIPSVAVAAGEKKPLIYDLSVQEKSRKDPFNFVMTFDTGTGDVSVLGKGFDEFANVTTDSGGGEKSSKADWSGNFTDKSNWNVNQARPGSFKLALYGNDIAGTMPANPKSVKVFYAPDGGDYKPSIIDFYVNLWCESSSIPSTCSPRTSSFFPPALGPANSCGFIDFVGLQIPLPYMTRMSCAITHNIVAAMMFMTRQLTVLSMHATLQIGALLDAKQQLEVQRDFQQLSAQAHKDYQPSEMMCQFGSFVKSVPRSEEVAMYNKQALNGILMSEYNNIANSSGAEGYAIDIEARIRQFRAVYCDPRDNNDGLAYMCEHDQDQSFGNSTIGAAAPNGIGAPNVTPLAPPNGPGGPPHSSERKNKDIDFTRTAYTPLTLDLDFTDNVKTADEEDIIALARNLYWPRALESAPWKEVGDEFYEARHLFAMENIAHNSFIELASMKAHTDAGLGAASGWNFMKSLMMQFGLSAAETHQMLGDYPSYYAQMEVLTKKIYQSPGFYTNLYDTPANIKRISVSMDAIKVMQQQDMLDSMHRREMLDSLMVVEGLEPRFNRINAAMTTATKQMQ